MSVVDRLFGRCEWVGTCWRYPGTKIPTGYRQVWLDGRMQLAHRVAWEIANGPIPDGLMVCHTCDNRWCVNPAHLFVGTHMDNVRDMVAKGRHQHGDSHSRRKLTACQVAEIRNEMACGGSRRVVAARYGIRPEYVNALARGVGWVA